MAKSPRSDQIGFCWDIGIHSYIAARTASEWGYWHVAGRNAHFAVELLLKYLLVLPSLWYNRAWPNRGRPAKPAELHTHDLVRLWGRFDRDYPSHPLGQYADFVKWLNHWEDIRYAQYMDATPTVFATSIEAGANAVKANPLKTADVFVFDVPEMDRFFRAVMDFIGITAALRGNRTWFGKGWDAYARGNSHVIA